MRTSLYRIIFSTVLVFIGLLCSVYKAEARAFHFALDTNQQIKFNRITAADRKEYNLTIDSGKFMKGPCDPQQLVYHVVATLTNNSDDTLRYIDWSGEPCIWCIDKSYTNVTASNFYPFNNSVTKNTLDYTRILPHQNLKTSLNIWVNGAVDVVNQKFKIGIILQRIIKNEDFRYYVNCFIPKYGSVYHDLGGQTINLIWSNKLLMKK